MGSPVHRSRRNLWLEDRRHRHRVARHLAQAMVELRRIESRQLNHGRADARAAVTQLAAQRLLEPLDRVLGAAVRRLEGNPAVRQRRAHLDDRPAIARQHPLERGLGSPHRPQIGHPRGSLVFLGCDVVEEREHGRHRVVHPDVDRAEMIFDRRGGSPDSLEVAHVSSVGVRGAAEPADVGRGAVQAGRVPARSSPRRRRGCEFLRDRPADASGCAGDDDYLALSHFATPARSPTNASMASVRSSSLRARRIDEGCAVSVTSSARSESIGRPAIAADADLRAEQRLARGGAEAHQRRRLDHRQLGVEPGQARGDLPPVRLLMDPPLAP